MVRLGITRGGSILVVLVFTLILQSSAFAVEVCPSVADVKRGDFHGWQLVIGDKPATAKEILQFENTIYHFFEAEWFYSEIFDEVLLPFAGPIATCGYSTMPATMDRGLVKNIPMQNMPNPNYWFSAWSSDDWRKTLYACAGTYCPFESVYP